MIYFRVKDGHVGCGMSFNRKDIVLRVGSESQLSDRYVQTNILMTIEEAERLIMRLQDTINMIKDNNNGI